MDDLSMTDELLADIDRQILAEEAKVRDQIERIGYDDAASKERWARFHQAIKPLVDQKRHIIDQLVAIEACKPRPVIVVPAGTVME